MRKSEFIESLPTSIYLWSWELCPRTMQDIKPIKMGYFYLKIVNFPVLGALSANPLPLADGAEPLPDKLKWKGTISKRGRGAKINKIFPDRNLFFMTAKLCKYRKLWK